MPLVLSSAIERGCTSPVGWLPALIACISFDASALNVASAKMERQELPVHKNRIFNLIHFINKIVMSNTADNCAKIKPATSIGAMPTNVLVRLRANVTAGFAKKVEEVNQ